MQNAGASECVGEVAQESGEFERFVGVVRTLVEKSFGDVTGREYAGIVAECASVAKRDGLFGGRDGDSVDRCVAGLRLVSGRDGVCDGRYGDSVGGSVEGCDADRFSSSFDVRQDGESVERGSEVRGHFAVRDGSDGLSGASGGEADVRGKNWKKNQRKAMKRKAGKKVVFCESVHGEASEVVEQACGDACFVGKEGFPVRQKDALRLSLEKKWALENELKAAKAARELELLRAEDLSAVKRLRERKVQGATERTMVQIEKAHASLVQTGNVPGVQPVQQGFCQTVVDGEIVESVPGLSSGESKGCSISPSSSISEREVRQMRKECEDLKAELDKLKRQLKRTDLAYDVLRGKEHVAVSVVDGSVPESARWALDQVCGKGDWEAVGDLDFDPDTLYLQMDRSLQPGDYAGY